MQRDYPTLFRRFGLLGLIVAGLVGCGQSVDEISHGTISRAYVVNAKTTDWVFCHREPARHAPVVYHLRSDEVLRSLPVPLAMSSRMWVYVQPAQNEKAQACFVRRKYLRLS